MIAWAVCSPLWAQGGPFYSSASIVNAASSSAGPLAPNTIASVYGKDLSWVTKAVSTTDITTRLPTALPAAGVRVLVGGMPAGLYYVSPGQVNFLVPASLIPGPSTFQLVRDGYAGPSVPLTIAAALPGLFLQEPDWAIATRPDGSIVTRDTPAHPGDVVILYGTGFGQTLPTIGDNAIPVGAVTVEHAGAARVLLDGAAVAASNVHYIGVTPGFAGLYQLNMTIPSGIGANPEIVVELEGQAGSAGVRLPASP